MSIWPRYDCLTDEERVYVEELHRAPLDYTTRQVYADWLEDHDRPEDADFQRGLTPNRIGAAERYLRDYHSRLTRAHVYGYPPANEEPDRDDSDYEPVFSFEELLAGAHEHLEGGWGLTLPFDTPDFVFEETERFWEHFAAYTGRRIKPDDGEGWRYGRGPGRFLSCSC